MNERKLRGLAWDDDEQADKWMVTLAKALRQLDCEIKVTRTTDLFLEEFRTGCWDFVVLDVYQKGRTKDALDPAGLRLAQRVLNTPQGKFIPIFLVTENWTRLGTEIRALPGTVHFMSKNVGQHLVAEEIGHKLNSSLFKDPKKVFVVHGKAAAWLDEVTALVRSVGLDPVVLERVAGGALTLIEKLERYSDVGCAIVLVTPDDLGSSIRDTDFVHFRVRQNVLLELGYFYGHLGKERLVLLAKGEDVEWPSMLGGLVPVQADAPRKWQARLVEELLAAGLHVRRPAGGGA